MDSRTRRVYYMAHPVGGDVDGNIKRALRWIAWLRRSFPGDTFVAPWIEAILSGQDDNDPEQREAGLVDCEAVVPRCDGIVCVGGQVTIGMAREGRCSARHGRLVFDLTGFGPEPPRERLGARWGFPLGHPLLALPFARWGADSEVSALVGLGEWPALPPSAELEECHLDQTIVDDISDGTPELVGVAMLPTAGNRTRRGARR